MKFSFLRKDSWGQRGLILAIDTCAMSIAYLCAFLFRLDFQTPYWGWAGAAFSFGLVWLTQVVCLSLFGCYRIFWRFTSLADLPRFAFASMCSTSVLLLLRWLFPLNSVCAPFSITLLNFFFSLFFLLAVRLLFRMVVENGGFPVVGSFKGDRVLLIGAGDVGDVTVRELKRTGQAMPAIVGFLDDEERNWGADLHGIRVLGSVDLLEETVGKAKVTEVIVAKSRVTHERLGQIVRTCKKHDLPVRILPEYTDLISGKVSFTALRKVEVTDLLGRAETQVDSQSVMRLVGGKRVLVTGAGGSIGSEIVRQVLRYGPKRLYLVERSEFALYQIDRELRATIHDVDFVPLLADVTDTRRMEQIFGQVRPDIVIHAAAYKHVPMMELFPGEAIRNNVLATRSLGELALRFGVDRFVLISTDKAVRPISLMGMSKRMAEIVLQDLNGRGKTRFSAVRFGNVLDSSGSVVPLFREQIRAGGPVTVTHPEMKRYFMTISEAVSLVLQAAALAEGGEIFVLDMGKPVKIVDLAETMISLSGFHPYEEIPIVFTGVRPGEKLFEELDVSERSAYKTGHARIFVCRIEKIPSEQVKKGLEICGALVESGQGAESMREALGQMEWGICIS